jgi:hypothetical protein
MFTKWCFLSLRGLRAVAALFLLAGVAACSGKGRPEVAGALEIRDPFLAAGDSKPERRTQTFGARETVWLLFRLANFGVRRGGTPKGKGIAGEVWIEEDVEVRDSGGQVVYSEAGVMKHHGRVDLRGLTDELPIQTRIEMLEERPPGAYEITAVVRDRLTDREARASVAYKVE